MKFFRKPRYRTVAQALACVGLATWALRAELTPFLQNIDASSRLEQIFFRNVPLPGGLVPVRRPPKETRADLTRLLTASPNDAELISLRALEDEQQLDFTPAEADWKRYVDAASDKGAARVALADYYHRRLDTIGEFNSLTLAALEPPPASDPRRPYQIYERMIRMIDERNINPEVGAMRYEVWEATYPTDPAVYKGFFEYSIAHKLFARAIEAINDYIRAFPQEVEFPVAARAEIAAKSGTPQRAMAELDSAYRPLWPDALIKQYFDVLRQNNALRIYLEKARAGAQPTRPTCNTRRGSSITGSSQGNMLSGRASARRIPPAQGIAALGVDFRRTAHARAAIRGFRRSRRGRS